jgi:purine-binding chemotaxis protein CheW
MSQSTNSLNQATQNSSETSDQTTLAVQYSTFTVGKLFLGIDVKQVQEVVRFQELTRIPLASAEIGGLINLRGQIVTAIDLRRRLEVTASEKQSPPMNVVVRTEDGAFSLLVDEINDVVTPDPKSFEPAPATLQGPVRQLITGAFKLDGKLLLVLSTEKVLDLETAQAA